MTVTVLCFLANNKTDYTLFFSCENEQSHHTQQQITKPRIICGPDCKHSKIGSINYTTAVDVISRDEELVYSSQWMNSPYSFGKVVGHAHGCYLPLSSSEHLPHFH